jgi:hypothetical protein
MKHPFAMCNCGADIIIDVMKLFKVRIEAGAEGTIQMLGIDL